MIQVKSIDDADMLYNTGGGGGMVENLFQSVPVQDIPIQAVIPQTLPMEVVQVLPPPLETNIGGVAGAGAATFAKNTKIMKKVKPWLIGSAILAGIFLIYSLFKKRNNGKRKY